MNIVRKTNESMRKLKAERKRERRETRRKLKAADATRVKEATRSCATPPK